MDADAGFLYVFEEEETGYSKVGRTQDPFKRLRHLQRATPHRLTLVAVAPVCHGLQTCERVRQDWLAPARVRGEWYATGWDTARWWAVLWDLAWRWKVAWDAETTAGETP